MKKKLESDRVKNIYLIVAIIHLAISFYLDKFIFRINIFNLESMNELSTLVIMKSISFLLYIFIWQKIGKMITNIRNKDEKTLKMFKYFLIYFIINIILLILTWPGIWRWDEFNILHHVSYYKLEIWQNYMTSIFYLLSYMLIPIPSGVIVAQIVVASGIVSYIIYNFRKIFKNSKLVYLLYIPFLLLPVLDHNLYPLRLTLYSYIELLLICKLIFIKKLMKYDKKDFLELSTILIILCSLRTEGMLFILLIPIIYLILFKKEVPNIKQRIGYVIFTIIVSILFIIPQEMAYKKTYSRQYQITSYVNQLHVVVKNELAENADSNEIKDISKVIDIDELMKYTRGIYAHNAGRLYKPEVTEEDYKNFKKAYNKLLLKYPADVIGERLGIFLKTSGFVNDYNVHVEDTRQIYTQPANRALWLFRTEYGQATQPINLSLRNAIINILEGHNINDSSKTNITFNIFYNLMPSILIMMSVSVLSLFRKKYIFPIIMGIQLLKTLAIIMTAPDCFFMYYLPTYLTGYFIGILLIITILYNKNRTEKLIF